MDDLVEIIATMWVGSQGWGSGIKLGELDEFNCANEAREFARNVINTVNAYKHPNNAGASDSSSEGYKVNSENRLNELTPAHPSQNPYHIVDVNDMIPEAGNATKTLG